MTDQKHKIEFALIIAALAIGFLIGWFIQSFEFNYLPTKVFN